MRKRVNQAKEVIFKVDFNDKKVGIWGLLALILIVFGFIIAPLMPGLFDTTDSSSLKFGFIKDNQFIMKKTTNLLNMLNLTQIFILN